MSRNTSFRAMKSGMEYNNLKGGGEGVWGVCWGMTKLGCVYVGVRVLGI